MGALIALEEHDLADSLEVSCLSVAGGTVLACRSELEKQGAKKARHGLLKICKAIESCAFQVIFNSFSIQSLSSRLHKSFEWILCMAPSC